MTTVVMYHANCYDGFGAAWVANEAMAAECAVVGDDLIFIPARYEDDEIPDLPNEITDMYLLDFTYKRDKVLGLANWVDQITIIDHHESAADDLRGIEGPNIDLIFDMSHSGAILTWNTFLPGEKPPALLKYIEDRDLWTKQLPGTDEVNSALRMYPMNFETWDNLIYDNGVDQLRAEGGIILEFTNQQVANICNNAYTIRLGDWEEIPVVNTSVAWSEVGHELLRRFPMAPFVASFTILDERTRKWSLRSDDGRVSVRKVAEQLGVLLGSKPGGGHRNAAGFTESISLSER